MRDDSNLVTEEWLGSIGFSTGSMSMSKLIHPHCSGAIIELTATPDAEPGTGWMLALLQGYPDDVNSPDDHVAITSLPKEITRGHVRRLLEALSPGGET